MFIHEMSVNECHSALRKATIGRLGCALNNQPYVVPVNFAFDGTYLYGFTTIGQKVEWLRTNPLVCFEVDKITGQNDWMSIVLFGSYQELPDKAEYAEARIKAHAVLLKRAAWWEPAYISQQHRDQPHSLTPIFYRIHIDKITGHRATSEDSETIPLTPSKRGCLEKLLGP